MNKKKYKPGVRTIRVKERGTGEYIDGILGIGIDTTDSRTPFSKHKEVNKVSEGGKIRFEEPDFPTEGTERTFSFFDPTGVYKTVLTWVLPEDAWDSCVLMEREE